MRCTSSLNNTEWKSQTPRERIRKSHIVIASTRGNWLRTTFRDPGVGHRAAHHQASHVPLSYQRRVISGRSQRKT